MDGDNVENLLVDSPDGLIKIDHRQSNANCCETEILRFNCDNISVEFKSPYPDAEKIPVHYKLPKYYILQVLIHMAVTDTDSNCYGCCGPKSLVLIDCKFDEDLWKHLCNRIKTFLDKDKPVASQWIKDIVCEFKDKFNKYIEESTELIGEVPLIHTDEDPMRFLRCATQFSPYHKPAAVVHNRDGPDLNYVWDIINLIYLRTTKVIRNAYQILREEASEIIAFFAADSSRLPHPGLLQHIPIAYGLKGHSLPMSIMRQLVHDVRDKCQQFNVNVRCEVYDGQFLNLVRFTEDGTPLT